MNISSIIIKIAPPLWKDTCDELSKIPHFEIALQDQEKQTLIGVIEAENSDIELFTLKQISATKGVISANMHLSYSQEDLKQTSMTDLAEFIDTAPIEEMRYSGNIDEFLKKYK